MWSQLCSPVFYIITMTTFTVRYATLELESNKILYIHMYKYRIAGKFGGGKVWRIWQIVRDLPN